MDNLTKAITELGLDTENAEKNYALAIIYETLGQTASAFTYFYRAAERTKNKELAYECLLKASLCFERQGNRNHTVRRILQHAVYVRPKRPEGYYLLSRILERTNSFIDGYTFASMGLQICDFDCAPLRSDVEYPGQYGLLFQKAVCGWHWGKNEESRNILLELNSKYYDEMDNNHKNAVQNNLTNLVRKITGTETRPFEIKEPKRKTIVDCFPYYDNDRELLDLRVNMLKDHVDYFIITECNTTHSGIPTEYKLKERIEEYGLPKDKIIIVELNMPKDEDLPILDIDRYNSGEENNLNINSVRARARERLHKDGMMTVLDRFDENTFFIVSDCDEIIDPNAINFIVGMVASVPKNIIKVPLVWLEGRADLRVYDRKTNEPMSWKDSLFVCSKKHLQMANPVNIRSGYNNPFSYVWCTQNNKIIEDLGWHLSWMGGSSRRRQKRKSFIHYEDNYNFLAMSYKDADLLVEREISEGDIAPSLEANSIMKNYNPKFLLDKISNMERIREHFLPSRS